MAAPATLDPTEIRFAMALLSQPPDSESTVFETLETGTRFTHTLEGDDADRFALSGGLDDAKPTDIRTSIFVTYRADAVGRHTATLVARRHDGHVYARCELAGETRASDRPIVDGGVTAVAFGHVDVGTTALGAVNVRTFADDADYTFTATLATGERFTLASTSASTSGGGSVSFPLNFVPVAEEGYTDTLTIHWSRSEGTPTEGDLVVDLSGFGVLDDDDALADDTDSQLDDQQRATFAVPTHDSVVNLGAAYALEVGRQTQSGFSATTTRNVWLEADKTVTVQSEGHTWFQSTHDATYLMAGKRSALISRQAAYVVGGAYLGLMAGYGTDTHREVDLDDDGNPGAPKTAKIDVGFLLAEVLWGVMAKLGGAANLAKTVFDRAYLDDPTLKAVDKKIPTGALKAAFGVPALAVALTTSAVRMAYGKIAGTDLQSVSMFSEAGINAGTPSVTTIAGLYGTSTYGLNVSLMGFAHMNLEGVIFATVDTFGDAAILAGREISCLTAEGRLIIASRGGETTLTGATISLGNLAPRTYAPTPTTELWMDVIRSISFEVVGAGAKGLSMLAPTIELQAGAGEVKLEAYDDFTIGMDVAYRIEASAGGITISSPTGPVVQVLNGTIVLGPAAGAITQGAGAIDIGGGGIAITPGMTTVNLGLVDLL